MRADKVTGGSTMRRNLIILISLILAMTPPLFPRKKLAQTGFKFLSVTSDARGGALGDAMTTIESGSSALFFNPACMARLNGRFDATFSMNSWIADIQHNAFSLAFSPATGRYGVFGVSFTNVDYGNVIGTMVWGNEQGFIETGTIKPSAFAVGVGYAKALTDKFAVGGQVKIATQNLGNSFIVIGNDSLGVKHNIAASTSFDFGTTFRTGFKSLVFGMSLRNYSDEIVYEREGFQLPLTFRMGLSMNVLDLMNVPAKTMACVVSVDAVHPRDYPEQVMVGVEYRLMNMFSLRAGYINPSDERHLNFGFGVHLFGATVDYAFTPFGVFDNVQRLTLRFGL